MLAERGLYHYLGVPRANLPGSLSGLLPTSANPIPQLGRTGRVADPGFPARSGCSHLS